MTTQIDQVVRKALASMDSLSADEDDEVEEYNQLLLTMEEPDNMIYPLNMKNERLRWVKIEACDMPVVLVLDTWQEKEIFLLTRSLSGREWNLESKKDITRIENIEKSHSHAIENIYHVKALTHNLLSVWRICDKGNQVVFTSDECTLTRSKTKNLVLRGKRHKNVYTADAMAPLRN